MFIVGLFYIRRVLAREFSYYISLGILGYPLEYSVSKRAGYVRLYSESSVESGEEDVLEILVVRAFIIKFLNVNNFGLPDTIATSYYL